MKSGDVLGGRFRLDHEIAHGGMGTVFRGFDLTAEQRVAVKVIRHSTELDEAIESGRFAREVDVLSSLSDPNIVRYVSHGTTRGGEQFLCQEWIDGVSLSEPLSEIGLTLAESVAVAAAVAAGLATVHASGIVHRDVKPTNILLVGGDPKRIKLIDFGIARRSDDDVQLTRTGTLVGTPGYMSPEQARGERGLDPRTDVFSLGCVLYECLTGRAAFPGHGVAAVRTKVLLSTPPSVDAIVPEVGAELSAVIVRMLAKDPDERFRDGKEVALALAPFATPHTPTAIRRRRRSTTWARPLRAVTAATAHDGHLACVVIGDLTRSAISGNDLRAAVAEWGGRVETIGAAFVLVTTPPSLPPSTQVARCARCAIALRDRLHAPIAVTGIVHDPDPDDSHGDAVDWGIALLTTRAADIASAPAIWIDPALTEMLELGGFELLVDESGIKLT